MTACAIGCHVRAEFSRHPVIAVQVAAHAVARHSEFLRQADPLMTLRAGRSAERSPGIAAVFYGVNAVTIRADGRPGNASGGCLPVNALIELDNHACVAFGARLRNIRFENWRLIVGCGQYVVAVMAIRANSSAYLAARDPASVSALLVSEERAIADACSLHKRFVAVTRAARLSDVNPVDC